MNSEFSVATTWRCILVVFVLLQVASGCQEVSKAEPTSTQVANRESSVQIQKTRSRLRQIRVSLSSRPIFIEDREFVIQTAESGDIVSSGLAFLLLDDLAKVEAISRKTVIEVYVSRLVRVRGMNAVLTLRNLEALLVPDVHAGTVERDALIALIRQHQQIDQFGAEEVSRAEVLSTSTRESDILLLVELVLCKHSSSQVAWVRKTLNRKTVGANPTIREFIGFALRVLDQRTHRSGS